MKFADVKNKINPNDSYKTSKDLYKTNKYNWVRTFTEN